jgi:hypothetical protein
MAAPPDEAASVVRFDLLDPAVLTQSAQEIHSIDGFFGVSVFAEVGGLPWDEIASTKLRRAEWVVLLTPRPVLCSPAASLRDAGQAPHYGVVQFVGRILGCEHRVVRNPVHPTGDGS